MKHVLKKIRDGALDMIARFEGFHFPDYYPWWRMKRDMLTGRYEVEATKFFKKNIKPGMVVFDIGANIGYFTTILAKLVGPAGKVYAFEPDEENYRVLQKNVRRYPQVTALKLGVSDRVGSSDFYHVEGAVGLHSILPMQNSQKTTIQTTSVDAFAQQEKIARIDALKIDVEGYEPQVFAGMERVLGQHPVVVFEYTPDTSKEMLEDLAAKHRVFSLTDSGEIRPLNELKLRFGKRAYANVVLADRL